MQWQVTYDTHSKMQKINFISIFTAHLFWISGTYYYVGGFFLLKKTIKNLRVKNK